jgi:acyl-CoA synthetase (AMP-forming)/AMP-acid ligase II
VWGDQIERRTGPGIPFLVYQPRPSSLSELFAAGQRWAPRQHLVHRGRRMTFAEVAASVTAVARMLREQGIGPGERVLLLGGNTIPYVLAFWGVLEAGCVVVLGNGWWSGEEVAHAAAVSRPSLTIAATGAADGLGPTLTFEDLAAAAASSPFSPKDPPPYPAGEDDPAIILFTSGSTGRPKGAVLSHRACIALQHALMHLTRRLPHQLDDDAPPDVNLQTGPLFHIGGVQALVRTWLLGGSLVFPDGRFNPAEVVDLIESEQINRWGGVPTMVSRVLDVPGIHRRDLSSLRSLNMGGSAVRPELIERARAVFPNAARAVSQIYGLSEAGGTLTSASGRDLLERPGTVGRPLPVVELDIRRPGPDGVGEIFARSPAQMNGYFGSDADSPLSADGWLATGDLGRRDEDGYLYLTGRSRDLIIRGGENIAAVHVEAVLLGQPGVREVAVVGLPDADLGEIVGAVVTVADQSDVTADQLRQAARARLAYFEVPVRWWIRESLLPTNQAGKVDKPALRDGFPAAVVTDERSNRSVEEGAG